MVHPYQGGPTLPSLPSPITIKTRIMFSINMEKSAEHHGPPVRKYIKYIIYESFRNASLFYPLAIKVHSFIFRQSPSQDDYYVGV